MIEPQPWILESAARIDLASDNFVTLIDNSARLCSCYKPEKILDSYGRINTRNSSTTHGINSIKYISNDDSLIVLNPTMIRKLSAKNSSSILRSLSTSDYAVSILQNGSTVYIAFVGNRSINMYDLNLTLLATSTSWNPQAVTFGGMILWHNRILAVDVLRSIIWAIDALNQTTLSVLFNFTSYNISSPINLFIYQDRTLYISSKSRNLYVFNVSNSFALIEIITLPVNVPMLFMRYDPNCDRLWFGTQNYTYSPVLNLHSNEMKLYQTSGAISSSGIYSINFDENYKAFYTDTDGELYQIDSPKIVC